MVRPRRFWFISNFNELKCATQSYVMFYVDSAIFVDLLSPHASLNHAHTRKRSTFMPSDDRLRVLHYAHSEERKREACALTFNRCPCENKVSD